MSPHRWINMRGHLSVAQLYTKISDFIQHLVIRYIVNLEPLVTHYEQNLLSSLGVLSTNSVFLIILI